MDNHIRYVCKFPVYHIQSLRHIRSAITVTQHSYCLFSCLLTPWLCQFSILRNQPHRSILLVYNVSKTLAKVVASHTFPRHTHSSFLLNYLHWRLSNSVQTCRSNSPRMLSSGQPEYLLRCVLSYYSSSRSSNTNQLSVPLLHTAFASCGFSVDASTVWNSLPTDVRTRLHLHSPFADSLRPTFWSRSSAPSSGPSPCLIFGLKRCILLTYLHSKSVTSSFL